MKASKARRKEKRIQQLEKEVAEQKKGKTQKEIQTVYMDEVQIDEFLKALTERVEWSTNRIVDERPRPIIVERDKARELDGVATLLKWSMGALFFIAATLIVHFYVQLGINTGQRDGRKLRPGLLVLWLQLIASA